MSVKSAVQLLAVAFGLSFAAQAAAVPVAPALSERTAAIESPDDPAYSFTRPNPEAEIGKLPNGLTYGVMRRAGTRQVSIILYVGAGSGQETEGERGVAHFLEHMAFNGSKNFPPGTVMQRFAGIGVSIGRDQNAETAFDSTTFSLDLSEVTPERLDLAFSWLRDVADGLDIDQSQVDRERGVIRSEYDGSRGPMMDVALASQNFLAPELLGPKRAPIGLLSSINTVNADTIRGFYRRWYRPESSIVVAVGDLPRDELKARIEAAFGSWRNDTPAPPAPDPGHVDRRRAGAALSLVEGHVPSALQVCRVAPKDPTLKEGVASRTRDFTEQLWQGVLTRRLSGLASGAAPPFVSGQVDRDEVYSAAELTCVTVLLRDQDWRAALRAVSEETRRLALFGLTDQEYQAGLKGLNAAVEAEVGGAPTMTAAQLAQSIVSNLTLGGTFSTAEEDQRIGRLALAGMSREKASAEFGRVWSGAGAPLVVLISPVRQADAQLLGAWRAADASPAPARPVERQGHPWAYGSLGPPATVVSRTPLADIDSVRVAFSNGVRLNFKSSRNAQDRVEIRVRFGAGQQELAPADVPVARLGASLLREGGLGKNDYQDTLALCEGRACSFELAVGRDAFEIGGATRPSDLDVELQLISAYLADPGFRPAVDARIPSSVRALYQITRSDPGTTAALARDRALPAPRILELPDEHDLDRVKSADFARVLGPALRKDALEVTIVGDVDEDAVTQAVAKTLGALPPRVWRDPARADAPKIRYASTAPATVRVVHNGSPEKATVLATWPLFVWTPEKVREQRAVDLLSQIMQIEAIDEIRQRLGKAYSPVVNVQLGRGGDQGALSVAIDTSPAATGEVVAELKRIAQSLADGAINEDLLERARRPVLDTGATREISNPWWVTMLDGSWSHPDQLAAAKTWESDYEGITLDEVKAEARRWLGKDPLVVIAVPATQASNAKTLPHG
ncbi:MAG: insulinase family protein [Caulobacteraceae bacterium]|nr:insulinase family protein [Caulobacteraceae bacterium]